jgi:mannosyltransferase
VRFSHKKPYVRFLKAPLLRFGLALTAAIGAVLVLVVVGARQKADQIGRQGSAAELASLTQRLIDGSTLGAMLIGTLACLVAARAAFSARQHIMLRLWVAVPPVVLLASYSVLHLWNLRYVLFTLPALAILVANTLERPEATARTQRWTTVAMATALLLFGWQMQEKSRNPEKTSAGDYRAAARDLKAMARSGDAVAFGGREVTPRIPRLGLAYQLRGGLILKDVFVAKSMQELGRFMPEECGDPQGCVSPDVRRMWLLTSASTTTPFDGMPEARAQFLQREFVIGAVYPHWRANLLLLLRRRSQS